MPGINSKARGFEEFVLSVLKQICLRNKKPISTYYDDNQFDKGKNVFVEERPDRMWPTANYYRFDAILPNGIQDFNVPVFVDIKYNIQNMIFTDPLPSNEEHIMLYIVGGEKDREQLSDRIRGKNVHIWGKETINKWKTEFPLDFYVLYAQTLPELDEVDFDQRNDINMSFLRHYVCEHNISLALGAGVSLDFGALSWTKLIDDFYEEIRIAKKLTNIKLVREKIGNTSIINGQFAKDNLKDFMQSLYNGIYSSFHPITGYNDSTLSHLIPLIEKLQTDRRFNIITYNYDDYLEQYLKSNGIRHNSLYNETKIANQYFCVYHPHGFLPHNANATNFAEFQNSIVFSEDDYHKLYNEPYAWASILQYFLYRQNVYLFVGCSLTDPNLRRILSATKINSKKHFALMCKDNLSPMDQLIVHSHFMDIGVECIWADNFTHYKRLIKEILNQ